MLFASTLRTGFVRSLTVLFAATTLAALFGATAGAQQVARVPSGQWKAVLVSGSSSVSAYDAAAFDLGQRLRARGVARVATALTGGTGDFQASRAGIRQALEWLGSDQGACLFFATGHGNVAGLHLDADRRGRTLTPRELNRMLDEHCGDRPTVAIISDCDAGVFLDSRMRQPNRILIAASAKGRNSYGAKMSDRYVNFDRCLMAAIDSGAATWREAFERTLPCVQERETWLGVQPSQPQAFFGAHVANLAVPGATQAVAQLR
ncbi:MAG: hypothetical protein KF889_23950 [Alphaproteobacteria bacterium]|nr:hypothetical protein [Alphaproteobacteria bacterium]MCW5742511.1 hypothetical protein [Alphaproteobacteria bacterium]